MSRKAEIKRKTMETDVKVALSLDGSGKSNINTGIGFMDHMLTLFAAHGLFDLEIKATGDVEVDFHHTVEDVGIGLGQALAEAVGDKKGIVRYGEATIPMDEALAQAVMDFSGRPHLSYSDDIKPAKVGEMDTELFREFFEAFVRNSGITLHIRVFSGRNAHHIIEAVFKAVGRALDKAVGIDPRRSGVPSTKGTL